ncbi:alpha/beta hydrolase family protein [Faecalicoccus acidiformans]|uniref:alpha/beta hydrolase family protein n=2 Tax=Faecalicoccus acidiformans TaxID=915173 RepID=UPI002356E836|nr:alpha/beta hydrolase [Faecalicoccus acidiformans]
MEKRLFIPCEDHELPMILTYPDTLGPYPCMLCLHGFLSYKEGDGHLLQKSAQYLAEHGIASARIDFCSMGENRASRQMYGVDMCIKETHATFAWLQNDPNILSDRIGLLGHSLGGRIAILCADLPSFCIITLNGALKINQPGAFSLPVEKEKEIQSQGYTIMSTSDGRVELVFSSFLKDLSIQNDTIDHYKNPILVCVGAKDPTIDPANSYDFVQQRKDRSTDLCIIEHADHTFLAKTGNYATLYALLEQIVDWIQEKL